MIMTDLIRNLSSMQNIEKWQKGKGHSIFLDYIILKLKNNLSVSNSSGLSNGILKIL